MSLASSKVGVVHTDLWGERELDRLDAHYMGLDLLNKKCVVSQLGRMKALKKL